MASDEAQILTSKRQFLRGLAALIGASAMSQLVSQQSLASAFGYHESTAKDTNVGRLFDDKQRHILKDLCQITIPATDTPSAAELGVDGFIEHQLLSCYDKEQQQSSKAILDKIEQQSVALYSQSFLELTEKKKIDLLTQLEAQQAGFEQQDVMSFKYLKALLVFGYFTTEVGATIALNYQAVPGGFKGSVPYSTLKKSWGSLGFY